jgi:hypothetical protein
VLRVVQLSSATFRPLSEPAIRACRQLVCLHDMGNWHPTRRSGGVRASVWCHVAWTASRSETETARSNEQVVGGKDLSCEGETCRVKLSLSRRLVGEALN